MFPMSGLIVVFVSCCWEKRFYLGVRGSGHFLVGGTPLWFTWGLVVLGVDVCPFFCMGSIPILGCPWFSLGDALQFRGGLRYSLPGVLRV